jgi:hypothetical protein
MRIVDYASGRGPSSGPSKEVRFYVNADGSPGSVTDHHHAIVATVGGSRSYEQVKKDLQIPSPDEVKLAQLKQLKKKVESLDENRYQLQSNALKVQGFESAPPSRDEAIELLSKEIQQIEGQVERPGLEEPVINFGRPAQENGLGGGLLELQQRLNSLGNE